MIKECRVLFYASLILAVAVEAHNIWDIDIYSDILLPSSESYTLQESSNEVKVCRMRTNVYTREIYKFWSSYGCYSFTNEDRLLFRYDVIIVNYTDNVEVPVSKTENGSYFIYDYLNETSLFYLRDSFRTSHFLDLWVECASLAMDCCDKNMNNVNIYPTDEYPCPQIWDGWDCFSPSKANKTVKRACPRHTQSTTAEVCTLFSEKQCLPEGWVQKTEYGPCSRLPVYQNRHNFHVICLSVAIFISTPAAVIFLSFHKLRNNTRIILHRNLLIVIIIRCIFTIMSKEIVILDNLKSTNETNHVMENNGVPCRMLAFFEGAAKNGMYAFMLIDGFYLHKLIVRSFAKEPNLNVLYAIGAVLSFLPSLIWAILRASKNGDSCWMVDDDSGGDQWVLDGFRIVILVLNVLLLLDIIRVMVMKLTRSATTQSTSRQTKATLRATLFLMPLFGIHIIVITNRNIVPDKTCTSEDIYLYISYFLEAFQGIAVAILFCYLSAEVHAEIKNAFRKFAIYVQQRYGWNIRRETMFRRRTTAATYVDPDARRSEAQANTLNENGHKKFADSSTV